MPEIQTIIVKDGETQVLHDVDKFDKLLEKIKQAFIAQNGGKYTGYPVPPHDLEREAEALFKDTDDLQREWLFNRLLLEFVHVLQHWTIDLDKLYPADAEYPEGDVRRYMQKGWRKFFY